MKEVTAAQHRLPEGVAIVNNILLDYKRSARIRGHTFELTREETLHLMRQPCLYCNAPPGNKRKGRGKHQETDTVVYQGVDRIDNDLGYSIANCTPCCFSCNKKKKAMKFDTWIARISAA